VHDRAALDAALARSPDFVTGSQAALPNTAYAWFDRLDDQSYPLARLYFTGDVLVVDAFSPQRAERAAARVGELAGAAAAFDRLELDTPAVDTL
jgi:hypothetical protein